MTNGPLPALNDPPYESEKTNEGDEETPPPEQQEHLVIDVVETKNTDGIDVLLAPA